MRRNTSGESAIKMYWILFWSLFMGNFYKKQEGDFGELLDTCKSTMMISSLELILVLMKGSYSPRRSMPNFLLAATPHQEKNKIFSEAPNKDNLEGGFLFVCLSCVGHHISCHNLNPTGNLGTPAAPVSPKY